MNDSRPSAGDPRLTSYALGELDASEVPIVEAALRSDPELRYEVAEIRRCAAAMESALAGEAMPAPKTDPAPRLARPRARWIVFPQFYYVFGGLAAAGFAVLVAVNRESIEEKQRLRAENLRQMAASSTTVAIQFAPDPVAAAPAREAIVVTPEFGEAAYATVRRLVKGRQLPSAEVMQPAELVNAFRYRSPAPPAVAEGKPLAATLETGDAPWAPGRQLVRLGFRAREATLEELRQSIMTDASRSRTTIARDVRIQVEFNPSRVAGYRLIGRDEKSGPRTSEPDELATASQIQSGQGFAALYEIVPAAPKLAAPNGAGELLTVRLNFAEPTGGPKQTLEVALADRGAIAEPPGPSADFQLATAVAEYALVLRQTPSPDRAVAMRDVLHRAENATLSLADDSDGRRAEFVELVRLTQTLLE